MVAAAAAAFGMRRRRFLARFHACGAYSPSTARTLEQLGLGSDDAVFRESRVVGVLKSTSDGRWFLDLDAER